MTNEVNWEAAYNDLKSQVAFMMEDTRQLLVDNPVKLKINKIVVDKDETFSSLIVDASGDTMMYACYLYHQRSKKELVKTKYQYSNTFVFQLPKGKYFARLFVKNRMTGQKEIDTISFTV